MNGTAKAAWNLNTGGFMSATLEVDAAPNRDGMGGRIIVGQIHGQDDELVRLYWENGKLYFANDQAGSSNSETKFYFVNAPVSSRACRWTSGSPTRSMPRATSSR